MPFSIPIAVGIGGCVGALLRFYISGTIVRMAGNELAFAGTLTVNLIGCFFIGVLATVALKTSVLSPPLQQLLISGLLGSLTTYSTFALDTLNLLHSGRVGAALGNVLVNVVAGVFLAWAGMQIAERFLPVTDDTSEFRMPQSDTESDA